MNIFWACSSSVVARTIRVVVLMCVTLIILRCFVFTAHMGDITDSAARGQCSAFVSLRLMYRGGLGGVYCRVHTIAGSQWLT